MPQPPGSIPAFGYSGRKFIKFAAIRCVVPYNSMNHEGKEGLILESRLKQLFDYQRFENNKDLQSVIDSVHARYAKRVRLEDDDVEFLNAAGTSDMLQKKPDPEGQGK